ncbi:MAG: tRNA (N6-isopentenyl adenosine(37)-C2)-methylthiotransferase MiaB [Chloroflexi bacterium]|nr:tRNA (N6-isopentenyl adenosine(37)-C2)-methylthiotransferase MiaB [Chloroflexota bacterium]
MIETRPTRSLPVLDALPDPSAARGSLDTLDERLAEFRPEEVRRPSFFVWTLGCQMNKSDSEEMAGRLLAAGCPEAGAPDDADVLVINTCAIRETAEAKVVGRQGRIAELKVRNPGMRVVLTGCAVREIDRARLPRRYPAVDLFLRPDEEPEIAERLGLASAQAAVGIALGVDTARTTIVNRTVVSAADMLPATRAGAVAAGAVRRASAISAWLPIVYGCDKTCTYCIVPFTRGPERSRPFDDIVAEARSLAAAGYREVTLLGQNVNSYGHDLPAEPRFDHVRPERTAGRRIERAARPDLAELLRAVDAIEGPDGGPAIPRLRFLTSHPWDLSDRLIATLAGVRSVCEHLHLPVQSGDDAVLRRMGRQYTIAHYLDRIRALRDALPGIALSTDVIVGFCGETDAQYRATLDLLEEVRFDQVFAAAFSPRPGTPAWHLPDDVPAHVKRDRLNGLLALQEGIGLARNRAWLGRQIEVLVDQAAEASVHDHEGRGPDPDPGVGVRVRGDAGATTHPGGGTRIDPAAADPAAPLVPGPGEVRLAGRTREGKLVHLVGPHDLVGRLVAVRIVHAGPFSLRGVTA